MATQVDLRQLAVDRGNTGTTTILRKGRPLMRYGIPLMIVAGFVSVVAWSLRERFLPARSVTVVPVVLTQADVRQAGTPLFQAAGWVEPRPSAVVVSALVEGVIEELLVAEGQPVVKGQPIAKLIDADARLTVADAEASVRLREAELALAQGTLEAAKIQFEQPVQMQAALAEAEATLAKLQTEI
ncbi:MAG: biotin/lipoyl-binding protein, partial [Planctomyces sp.]|nr:biotin/lipoyl-binding protein [Planctomyces sp.]